MLGELFGHLLGSLLVAIPALIVSLVSYFRAAKYRRELKRNLWAEANQERSDAQEGLKKALEAQTGNPWNVVNKVTILIDKSIQLEKEKFPQ